MNRYLLMTTLLAATALAGCATPLSPTQKTELEGYRAKGMAVEAKNPNTGMALGILPGGGSFYSRNYGFGIANLLLWPISVLWDPISGRDGSEVVNYQSTVEVVTKKRDNELKDLDVKLASKTITTEQYMLEKRSIERKYAPGM